MSIMPYGMSMQRMEIPLKQKNIRHCLKPLQSMPMTEFMEGYELKIAMEFKYKINLVLLKLKEKYQTSKTTELKNNT